MSFTLGISGPTGAGKTTLATMIRGSGDVTVITEQIPDRLFMGFSTYPVKYCYSLQEKIINDRHALFMRHSYNEFIVADRTLQEDREVFLCLHHKLGFLSDQQYETLNALATEYESDVGCPDIYVYMIASIPALKARMTKNYAPHVLIENIALQLSIYNKWRERITVPVLDIDNTNVEMSKLQHIADWIYESLPGLVNCPCEILNSQWSQVVE